MIRFNGFELELDQITIDPRVATGQRVRCELRFDPVAYLFVNVDKRKLQGCNFGQPRYHGNDEVNFTFSVGPGKLSWSIERIWIQSAAAQALSPKRFSRIWAGTASKGPRREAAI